MELFILLSGILNLFLGTIIWLQNPKGRLNIGFGLFAASTALSMISDYVFRLIPSLLTLQAAYAAAALVPATAAIWILEFSKRPYASLPYWIKIALVAAPLSIVATTFVDGYLVRSITELTLFGYRGNLGFGFAPYVLYFLFYILFFFRLLISARNNADNTRKKQISITLFGIFLYAASAITFSLILPQAFGIFDFTLFDAPSLLFFVLITFYGIKKFQTFDTKIIATQLFIVSLSLFIFFRTVFAESLREQVLDGILLVSTITIGIFLIRSVTREVQAREEIERLAKDLRAANEKLKELDKLKSQFLSIASHDLRAPLTAIRNFMSIMLDGTYGKLPPAAEEGMHQVFERATEMAKSVESYLNVSRIEQGRMKYDFVAADLGKIVKDTASIFRGNIEEKGLSLSLNIPDASFPIKADIGKLQEVFNNLVDNSIKYTPEGSITITLEKRGNIARYTMQDTGVGMTQKTMQGLFKLFSPGEDSKKINPSSTGVGLYITKAHVEGHGGKVWAESDGVGKGSRFIVELPLAA